MCYISVGWLVYFCPVCIWFRYHFLSIVLQCCPRRYCCRHRLCRLIDVSFYSISGLSKNERILWASLQFHAHNPMNKQQQQINLIWRRSIPFFVFYPAYSPFTKETNWWMTNSKWKTRCSFHSNDKWLFQFFKKFLHLDWEINYITRCTVIF